MRYLLAVWLACFLLSAQTPEALTSTVRDWKAEDPYSGADRGAQKKYWNALLKASDEWIRQYPGELLPLHERFVALDMLDAPARDLGVGCRT